MWITVGLSAGKSKNNGGVILQTKIYLGGGEGGQKLEACTSAPLKDLGISQIREKKLKKWR